MRYVQLHSRWRVLLDTLESIVRYRTKNKINIRTLSLTTIEIYSNNRYGSKARPGQGYSKLVFRVHLQKGVGSKLTHRY